jgi:hypothetical protein
MRDDEDSVYEAKWRSAAHAASLQGRANTCPGNAPVQLSLAAGLVQGGQRGHCKATTRAAASAAETAQAEQRTGTDPSLERREGRASGGQGRRTGLSALQVAGEGSACQLPTRKHPQLPSAICTHTEGPRCGLEGQCLDGGDGWSLGA